MRTIKIRTSGFIFGANIPVQYFLYKVKNNYNFDFMLELSGLIEIPW